MLLKADMDEQPVQLVKETRPPIPATKRHAQRVDYDYDRAGMANIFRFTEPLRGWREATARTTTTKIDWAVEVARLLEGRYAKCATVILVVRRLRLCHTPKHGSWLNIAENDPRSLTRQCVAGRRFGALAKLQTEIAA